MRSNTGNRQFIIIFIYFFILNLTFWNQRGYICQSNSNKSAASVFCSPANRHTAPDQAAATTGFCHIFQLKHIRLLHQYGLRIWQSNTACFATFLIFLVRFLHNGQQRHKSFRHTTTTTTTDFAWYIPNQHPITAKRHNKSNCETSNSLKYISLLKCIFFCFCLRKNLFCKI